MKKLIEVLLCFIHPLAVILVWVNLAGHPEIRHRLIWAIFAIVPIVPFVYVLTVGDLW